MKHVPSLDCAERLPITRSLPTTPLHTDTPLLFRCRLSTAALVCRRWRALCQAPELLRLAHLAVTVPAAPANAPPPREQLRLRSFVHWLALERGCERQPRPPATTGGGAAGGAAGGGDGIACCGAARVPGTASGSQPAHLACQPGSGHAPAAGSAAARRGRVAALAGAAGSLAAPGCLLREGDACSGAPAGRPDQHPPWN